MAITKLETMVDPQVIADMIDAKLPSKTLISKIAKIDNTLVGVPGSTITVPKYEYIGDAEELAEAAKANVAELKTTTSEYKIKKISKQVQITDEAMLSGYGDPVGQAGSQINKSLAAKIDADSMEALKGATLQVDEGKISYATVVDAISYFGEEINTEKVMFINPAQRAALLLDPDFTSSDRYGAGTNVVMNGEIGKISNARVVMSKKVEKNDGKYLCPIVQLTFDEETEDETPALTIYVKRNAMVETERDLSNYTTLLAGSQHCVVALTDDSKVVVAKFAE